MVAGMASYMTKTIWLPYELMILGSPKLSQGLLDFNFPFFGVDNKFEFVSK